VIPLLFEQTFQQLEELGVRLLQLRGLQHHSSAHGLRGGQRQQQAQR